MTVLVKFRDGTKMRFENIFSYRLTENEKTYELLPSIGRSSHRELIYINANSCVYIADESLL